MTEERTWSWRILCRCWCCWSSSCCCSCCANKLALCLRTLRSAMSLCAITTTVLDLRLAEPAAPLDLRLPVPGAAPRTDKLSILAICTANKLSFSNKLQQNAHYFTAARHRWKAKQAVPRIVNDISPEVSSQSSRMLSNHLLLDLFLSGPIDISMQDNVCTTFTVHTSNMIEIWKSSEWKKFADD